MTSKESDIKPYKKQRFKKKNIIISLVLFIVIQLCVWVGMFERAELILYDSWFRFRGIEEPGGQVVVVALDEPSIRELGNLPWPRSVHADLLNKLKEAKVVGFDMLFNAPTNIEEDEAFAEAIKKHGKVVHAGQFTFEHDDNGNLEQVLEMPLNSFWNGSMGLGFVNTPQDQDQVVRRITMVDVNTFDVPLPCLGLAVAIAASGFNPTDLNASTGQILIGNNAIPTDKYNRAMPNFWGPKETFDTVSYIDVINGETSPSYFRDKIVLIGSTAAADRDLFPTPFTASNMVLNGTLHTPGVEVHASTVQSFLANTWYQQVPPIINVVFLFMLGLISSSIVTNRGPWSGLFSTLAIILLSTTLVYGFWSMGWWLNLVAPLVLIALTYTTMTATDFIEAELARRNTKAMFSRYVSADVVEELMHHPDKLSLGGTRQVVSIMFCDIRGFTAYSENKPPEEVVRRLNEYLTAITHVILNNNGTLDKYLGDGLMAIFGAPVHYEDHIEKAITAAVEIQQAVEELNVKWSANGAPPLKVGVGINTGSVLVGNVGSPERMDYTVIGEEVNLASRVEGLTKKFNNLIIISERSVKQLPDGELKENLQHLGTAEIKGFSKAVGVYTV